MFLLNWFTKDTKAENRHDSLQTRVQSNADELTQQIRKLHAMAQQQTTHAKGQPVRLARPQRRELLYSIVHDAMLHAGMLASDFKLKVLSLDDVGLRYLILIDLTAPAGTANVPLAQIEATIAHAAFTRHEIRVTAVYWRLHEHAVSVTNSSPASMAATPKSRSTQPQGKPLAPVVTDQYPPAFVPLMIDEVLAFKNARREGSESNILYGSGEIAPNFRSADATQPGFEDTRTFDPGTDHSVLGKTKYGDAKK